MWWFPKIWVPPVIIHCSRICPYEPSSLGYPPDYGNPHVNSPFSQTQLASDPSIQGAPSTLRQPSAASCIVRTPLLQPRSNTRAPADAALWRKSVDLDENMEKIKTKQIRIWIKTHENSKGEENDEECREIDSKE